MHTSEIFGDDLAQSLLMLRLQKRFEEVVESCRLSSNEITVFRALVRGDDTAVVAKQLGETKGTMESYVRSVLDKTDTLAVDELVLRFLRDAWKLDDDPRWSDLR